MSASPRKTRSIGDRQSEKKSGSCPAAGDIIWIDFDPTRGHEQRGRRPALVLTPRSYNERSELCVVCPITGAVRGRPFEVKMPHDHAVTGVVLANQLRSIAWSERGAKFAVAAPTDVLDETREKIAALLAID